MKYEMVNVERMNEYLSYEYSILRIYLEGKSITEKEYEKYKNYISELQRLNYNMGEIE